MSKLKTNISEAFYCDSHGSFNPVRDAPVLREKSYNGDISISWFDKLLEGGIEIPENLQRPVTLLITGPPGSGKSTLALELCHRWTFPSEGSDVNPDGFRSLYITTETNIVWAKQKAKQMGWDEHKNTIHSSPRISADIDYPIVSLLEARRSPTIAKYLEVEVDRPQTLTYILKCVSEKLGIADPEPIIDKKQLIKQKEAVGNLVFIKDPDVLVIDSLNVVSTEKQKAEFFDALTGNAPETKNLKLIIIVLESSESHSGIKYWEYVTDIVIRLDWKEVSDYMVRAIEIVKARYQSHVWGWHQLKFTQSFKYNSNIASEKLIERKRAHPYRDEGGIFIYPSIHYYLSAYKRQTPHQIPGRYKTSVEKLDKMLNEGLPLSRCTGFIGMRGGHKSHLAYLTILNQVIHENKRALVISLRDDEAMARFTMNRIIETEKELNKFNRKVEDLEKDDHLEILYFPPGYITPSEFFHRIFISIQRLKYIHAGSANSLFVLFNSLDQLSSRFPMCAKERIFIPGIIAMLNDENISSIFIGAEEPGQPKEQYGLLSMADALLSFKRMEFSKEKYINYLIKSSILNEKKKEEADSLCPEFIQPVIIQIVRFAGGQSAGDNGILELVEKRDTEKYSLFGKNEGLQFVTCPPLSIQNVDPKSE